MHKILIVEDDKLLLKALEGKFTQEGFEVTMAADGDEGLESALKNHPDIILLDVLMPGTDGITVLKLLRQDVWGKDVQVIVLTNLADDAKVKEAESLNAVGYLIKSDWQLEEIVKKVKQRLNL